MWEIVLYLSTFLVGVLRIAFIVQSVWIRCGLSVTADVLQKLLTMADYFSVRHKKSCHGVRKKVLALDPKFD